MIKLNGGLGTSMGMTRAKSLLEAREGLSFLDVIARQVGALRAEFGVRLPLVLMHSLHTRADSLAALDGLPDVLDFLQHRVPKLRADDLERRRVARGPGARVVPARPRRPVRGAAQPPARCDALLAAGVRYAFVSNADNLGAVLDPVILEWFARSGAPFAMETVIGTEADRKGGHIARRDGRLVLRETAQAESGRVVRRPPALALLQHEQPLARPRGARRAADAAADRQPQDSRPVRSGLARR